jgi:hypothetical protein
MSPLVLGVLVVLVTLLWCGIASRLGYPGAMGRLTLFPFLGIAAIIYWACAVSPNEMELRRLRAQNRR